MHHKSRPTIIQANNSLPGLYEVRFVLSRLPEHLLDQSANTRATTALSVHAEWCHRHSYSRARPILEASDEDLHITYLALFLLIISVVLYFDFQAATMLGRLSGCQCMQARARC